jgi:RNA polymerase sigma factor (sigma-70 family)
MPLFGKLPPDQKTARKSPNFLSVPISPIANEKVGNLGMLRGQSMNHTLLLLREDQSVWRCIMATEAVQQSESAQLDFHALMEGVSRGNDDAVLALVKTYGHHVLRIIRQRRRPQLRNVLDSADLVQSVWASFFRDGENIHRFSRFEQLAGFLAAIAEHKVAEKSRAALRIKRDARRRFALDDMREEDEPMDCRTPSVILLAKERLENLLTEIPPHYQDVICRRAAGETTKEIADSLGIHPRTVWKIVEHVLKSERY